MKYVRRALGEAADVSAGGGERGFWREVVTVVSVVVALVATAYLVVGWLVEWTLPRISAEREQRWFADFPVPGGPGTAGAAEPAQHDHVAAVLARLTVQPEVPAIRYRVVILTDPDANATAWPGGTIAVTTGLLDVVGDDDVALAFVLGHELGHFAQRDHLRGAGRELGRGLVWWMLFGGSGGADVLSQRLYQLIDLGHSRQQERGADEWGVRLVLHAYGTTAGGDRLFRWLAERDGDRKWLTVLSTHPASADRVEALRRYAARLGESP